MSGCNAPTLAGFVAFIQNVMDNPGVPQGPGSPTILPPNSPVIAVAYQVALMIVNPELAGAPGPGQMVSPIAPSIYALAVYNLAGSNLLNYAQDQSGETFFTDTRKRLGMDKFAPGVIGSTSDASTSTGMLNPDFMRGLTVANLQQLKDPYGRQYLALAQSYGPTIWGLT